MTLKPAENNNPIRDERDQWFELTFNNTAVCKALVSPEGEFLKANSAFCEMIGYAEAELIGVSFAEITHPADLNSSLNILKVWNEQTEMNFRVEKSYIHRNGRIVRAHVNIAVLRHEDGRPKYAFVELVDITHRWNADEERRRIFELSADAIVLADLMGRIIQVNPAFCTLLGYPEEELIGKGVLNLTHPEDRESTGIEMSRLLLGNKIIGYEHRMLTRVGDIRWLSWNASLLPEKERMFGVARDITEAKIAERHLRHAALHDLLTGLPNRNLLTDRLTQALRRAKRDQSFKFALLFLDLNGFKQINDEYGHPVGDEILIEVASRLRLSLRDLDTAAYPAAGQKNDELPVRLGGDEFVILLDGIAHFQDAVEVARRIEDNIAQPYIISSDQLHLTTSIGVVTSEQSFDSPIDVLRAADKAMYEHKRILGKSSRHRPFNKSA